MSDKFIKIGIAACAVVIVYLSWNCVTYKNDVESNQAAIEEYKKNKGNQGQNIYFEGEKQEHGYDLSKLDSSYNIRYDGTKNALVITKKEKSLIPRIVPKVRK